MSFLSKHINGYRVTNERVREYLCVNDVCVCVCVFVCVCVIVYMCCVCVHVCICLCVCVRVLCVCNVPVFVCVCMFMCVSVCVRECAHVPHHVSTSNNVGLKTDRISTPTTDDR